MPEQQAVAPETLLFRRVADEMLLPHGDCLRIKSALFKQTPSLSVVIEDTLRALDRDPESVLDGYDGQSLISFPARAAFARHLQVERSPQADEPAHGDVTGTRNGGTARALLNASTWIVAPDGACATPAG